MPSDKDQATTAASSSVAASTRPKTTATATVAAAADSSRPSPKAVASTTSSILGPSAAASSGTSGSTSSAVPGTSRTPGTSRSSYQPLSNPVVLNTLRDPSHYEELNVIGNGETEIMHNPRLLGRQVVNKVCKMCSESCPSMLRRHGSSSTAQRPTELAEINLQNLFHNLPPQTVYDKSREEMKVKKTKKE